MEDILYTEQEINSQPWREAAFFQLPQTFYADSQKLCHTLLGQAVLLPKPQQIAAHCFKLVV